MTRFTLFQSVAVLMLAIAVDPSTASAQDGTLIISGTFSMDYLHGELDLYYAAPELLTVYNNGHEHTWTLTLHGPTQSHYLTNWVSFAQGTEFVTTSFDLEFFGPDAAMLNGIVSDHLAGGEVVINLENYDDYNAVGYAYMRVLVLGGEPGMKFYTGHDWGVSTHFPTDAEGYPVVSPEPFSIETDYTELGNPDLFSSTGGAIGSLAGLVTFEVVTAILPGDYNNDGKVDAADYVVWRNSLSDNAQGYLDWRTHFGQIAGSGSATTAVPEPATSVYLLFGIAGLGWLARRPSSGARRRTLARRMKFLSRARMSNP